jgi:hypothetical protein
MKDNEVILRASVELLRTTLYDMPSKEADRVVGAVIELLSILIAKN